MSVPSTPTPANERSPLLKDVSLRDEQGQSIEGLSATKIIKLTVLFLGAFIASLDTSFVIATYNRISSEFSQVSVGPWVLNGYNLGYTVVLPIYGALGDRYGGLPSLMISYVLFASGCALSGLAGELWHVVVGRILSGAGGAGMAAMVTVVITEMTSSENVAMYRNYINLVSIAGRSSGGPIGGLITDAVGWRWSFIGQTPIIILCWIVVIWLYFAPETQQKREGQQGSDGSTSNVVKKKQTVDFAGIIVFAVAMTSFLLIMTSVSRMTLTTKKAQTIVLAIAFATSIPALVIIEAYYAKQPLIPLDLTKGRLGIQMLIQFILLFAQFSIVSNAATYFVRTEQASNTTAALHLIGIPIGNAIGALAASKVTRRTKKYKAVSIIGASSFALGFILMTFRWHGRIRTCESFYLGLTSLGVGTVNSTQFLALTIGAPQQRMATIVSLFLLSQQIGMIVGTSTSSALLQTVFRHDLTQKFTQIEHGQDIIQGVLEDTRFAFKLPFAMQELVVSSYARGFSAVCVMSAAFAIMLQGILSIMKEKPLD